MKKWSAGILARQRAQHAQILRASRSGGQGWPRSTIASLLTTRRSLLTLFLIVVTPSLTVGLLPRAFSRNQVSQPTPSPSPSPAPSPSPSPTPPPNLHQWGAVTSFHGLPSDRTHAIAQTEFGVTWFATDGGLARYDGRRTNAINDDALPAGRVLALKVDDSGALWIGTDNGAARLANGKFDSIKETSGKVITAIITPERGRAIMASESGQIFDCRVQQANEQRQSAEGEQQRESRERFAAGQGANISFVVKAIPDQPLQSADKDHPGLLRFTSLAMVGDKLYAGTLSRGVLEIENGEAKEIVSKPRSFFINAIDTDARDRLWVGARGGKDESAVFDQTDPLKPSRANASTGPVVAIARGAVDDVWIGTDGHGAFHLRDGKAIEHFTFEGTGGALRSDHIYGIFVDRQEVIWFATDKGVCRYDPHAMRTENISSDPIANYIRALWRTSKGQVLAGTNAGLFDYDTEAKSWRAVTDLGRRIIYAISEDASGRVLIATSAGLFASTSSNDLRFTKFNAPSNLPQGDSVRAIANLNGVTYVGTYAYGVEKLAGAQRQLVWPETSADNQLREITCLGKDAADRLVIGTASAGIFFFDGKQTTTDAALDKLKGDAIWAATIEDGVLWFASAKGLYSFRNGELKEVAAGVNARALSLSGDQARGQLWCATNGNGLLRVARDDQFGAISSRLDIEQGLPSQRVFAVISDRDAAGRESVIIGTNRGIVRYETETLAPTVLPARIIGQRIHQPDELRTGLHLDYPQNSLLLDVTAISSRTFPEQFQYAFALYDNSGKIIREKLSHDSQFPMERLSAGKYKVVARAFTKDLLPATPLTFEFTVARAPFPWTSTALAVLLLLALIALGWGYVQNRRIHRTSAELASTNRELADARLRLANETEAERRRIARDLHDQTLADLRHLALMVDQLPVKRDPDVRPNRAPFAPGALRHEIESISQEVRRICEDLSPSALENVGLSAALQFALAHAVEQAPPDCKFTFDFVCDDALDEKLNLSPSTQIQIYRIAQEALSNICRHANAKHVKMSASVSPSNEFELRVEDDGRGFDTNEVKNSGRGVSNIRARASMIGGEVEWFRRDGAGTSFVLKLRPAGKL
jgi:signal transduction histidine kinase/ligand-binding sensor domain-containing protein